MSWKNQISKALIRIGDVREPRDVYCWHSYRHTCRQQRAFARRSTGCYIIRSRLFCNIQRYESSQDTNVCCIILSLRLAYDGGPGSISILWLCFFAFMTGIGGCAAFAGSIKTCGIPCTVEKHAILFRRSCSELAKSSGNGDCFPTVRIRPECVLFLGHILSCIPRRYG